MKTLSSFTHRLTRCALMIDETTGKCTVTWDPPWPLNGKDQSETWHFDTEAAARVKYDAYRHLRGVLNAREAFKAAKARRDAK